MRFQATMAFILTVVGVAPAAMAASESGAATATVQTPLALSNTTPLTFGQFAPGTGAGTITTGNQVTGGVSSLGGQSPGVWGVTGEPSANYTVTITDAVLEDEGGIGDAMSAALKLSNNAQTANDTLNGSGQDSFQVSGALSVGANQAAGSYVGTYTVTADYQ